MNSKIFQIVLQFSVIFIQLCSSHRISEREATWSNNYNEYSTPSQHQTYEMPTVPAAGAAQSQYHSQPPSYNSQPEYNSQSQSHYYSEETEKEKYEEPEKEEKEKDVKEETKVAAPAEPAPFIWTDITVPPSFLRIEYMIGYSFMGLMYGLGFLVLFQSLVVPTVKVLTAFVYVYLVYQGLMEPVTLQDALQQLPPT